MIGFSATNPCHVYDLAVALHKDRALRCYYSGYPAWRLRPPAGFPLVARSWRTVVTYGLLRMPHRLRPAPSRLFQWQDDGFDRAIANVIGDGNGATLHGLPGQALLTFQAARRRGWRTVLNHASGPVRQQLALLAPEYERAGLRQQDFHRFDREYFSREEAEYSLADFHCVASTIVAGQLRDAGVPAARIWVVPYAANPAVFHPPPDTARRQVNRVIFAGQLTQRKGLRVLFEAIRQLHQSTPIELHLYGRTMADIAPDLTTCRDRPWLRLQGPVSQSQLADAFRAAAILVLPSWEEAFGLVVPQALNCGLPCIVSNRVGAADLIASRKNGSIVPVGDPAALAVEIDWWLRNPGAFTSPLLTWEQPARRLVALTQGADS